jgi:hypothetical protein
MIRRISFVVVCVAMLVTLGTSAARAQGFGGMGMGGGFGLGFYNYGGYGGNTNPALLPFYALYPPVYYSYPVPRPYGYSPFAYPPGTMTPEVVPAQNPTSYKNPFVPQRGTSGGEADQTASRGRMYYNPFVPQSGPTASIAASDPPAAD